ncbi:proton-coupled folate transporter isoform X2 [Bombyx mori]|uniref:Adenylate cyclase n=1 Tax=Bombyx mori TaxID=7091 RepID=A0A8R2R679_BOMMO|nr:proton-coupled folate transporter isoform X2 [Bombyx mori]
MLLLLTLTFTGTNMLTSTENNSSVNELANSNTLLTGTSGGTWREKSKIILKQIKYVLRETTVEPCLFMYMMCTSISSLAVQSMHLEKACRVNFNYGDDICDRLRLRNTTGLDEEVNNVQSLVAKVVAWKFPLQTIIPAIMVIFVGAWSDKYKKRKICIVFPFIGEILSNTGLLFATYYFQELSLTATALIEALPAAFTGSYVIIFMGMYSFMADRTTVESRTFRLGLVTICVTLGTPTGTALSGILLRALGYYGVFSLLLVLYFLSFLYGLIRLEDVLPIEESASSITRYTMQNKRLKMLREVCQLVANTVMVALKPRAFQGRTQIFCILALYLLMVGPLYGTIFCILVLSKRMNVQDSIIGALAGVSRIAGCLMFALAPTRQWFYSAPLFNIFSFTGLTAIRSIATKSVPTEEVAKLSALIGVTESLAPSIYMPASSYIYMSTIETFPGAFYLFDAALTVVALCLFGMIYILARKKNIALSANVTNKEELARENEISRF